MEDYGCLVSSIPRLGSRTIPVQSRRGNPTAACRLQGGPAVTVSAGGAAL